MGITKGRIATARRRAENKLDEWNDIAGIFVKNTGYYFEIQSVIEDAVHCGVQAALEVEEPLPSEKKDIGVEEDRVELKGKGSKPSIEEIEKANAEGRDPRIQPDGTVLVKPEKKAEPR